MSLERVSSERESTTIMTVAVVIPTFQRPDGLAKLLSSLETSGRIPDEVIVVDNDPEGSAEIPGALAFPLKVVPAGLGLNISGARNRGAQAATSSICLFVDDDNVLDREALGVMVDAFRDPEMEFVGPVMFAGDTAHIWCAGIHRSHWTTRTTHLFRDKTVSDLPPTDRWVTADLPNCFAVRLTTLQQVGGFDERVFPFHFEEADLCKRLLRFGVQPYVLRAARVSHSGSNGEEDIGAELVERYRRHGTARVQRTVLSRVWFHRRYETGSRRVTTLLLGIPAWFFLVSFQVVRYEKNRRIVVPVLSAMGRGLYHGYADRIDDPPESWSPAEA
jgi:GT2 family glycosyltransferase